MNFFADSEAYENDGQGGRRNEKSFNTTGDFKLVSEKISGRFPIEDIELLDMLPAEHSKKQHYFFD